MIYLFQMQKQKHCSSRSRSSLCLGPWRVCDPHRHHPHYHRHHHHHHHRPWPAFGRQGLVGSSFEYSYTRLASRLRRSAGSGIMTWGNDKTNYFNLPTLRPSNFPTFRPSNLPTFRPSNLPTFQPSNLPTFKLSNLPTFHKSVLEQEKRQNPLNTKSVWKQEKQQNPLKKSLFQRILTFYCF